MASPLVGFVAVEAIAFGQRPVLLGHPLQRPVPSLFLRFDLDGAILRGDHVELISLSKPELIDQLWGSRTARLLPHLETCIPASIISIRLKYTIFQMTWPSRWI